MDNLSGGVADYELTAQAFGDTGKDPRLIRFSMEPRQNPVKSAKEGRPIFDEVEYIRIMVPGNKESIMNRPVRERDKQEFSKQYAAWKNNAANNEIMEGTPLEAWPPISKAQVEELRHFHVRTVEQLASVSDSDAQKFMGLARLRSSARTFMLRADAGKAETALQAAMEEKDSEIGALKAAIEDLKQLVSQQSQDNAPPSPPSPRRRAKT